VQAIILAGGLGTRLRGTVDGVPKSMAPVAGRPFLEFLLLQLRRSGFAGAVVCAGYRAGQLRAEFGDGSRWGIELAYSVEPEPLGTAGAIRLARPLLRGRRWLLMNGDSFFGISLAELVAADRHARATATIALASVDDARRYGRVECAPDGVVTRFVEKSDADGAGLVNAGIYVLGAAVLAAIPAGRPVSLEREVLPGFVGHGLHGVPFDAPFIDIGAPDDYRRAQRLGDRLAAG
jgi:NDP-sugar pyrophosphorylase family protein